MMSIESIHMNKKFLLFLAQKHKLLNEENLTKLLAENLPSDLIAQGGFIPRSSSFEASTGIA